MKLNMLVVMAISTLFAAAFACAAPATTQLADDTASMSGSNIGGSADQSTTTDNTNTSASIDSTSTDNSTSNNNDDMSADTATGDDDY